MSLLVTPTDGATHWLGGMSVRVVRSGGGVSIVEHRLRPHALAAPLHRHNNEDEVSIVLSGRVGALLGDEVHVAGPGDVVFKPRHQWHTFWNAGAEEASLMELIEPGGFEDYFLELVAIGELTPEAIGPVAARYALEMDPASIPGLSERFGVVFGGGA